MSNRLLIEVDNPDTCVRFTRFYYLVNGAIGSMVEVREEDLMYAGSYFGVLRKLVYMQESPKWM